MKGTEINNNKIEYKQIYMNMINNNYPFSLKTLPNKCNR